MLQLPDYAGTADGPRGHRGVRAPGGRLDGAERRARVERRAGRVRGIRLPEEHARRGDGESADAKRVAAQRRAWRGFLVALKAVFAFFLVASIVIVFMALVAMLIIMLTQGRDRGRDLPSSGRAGPSRGGGGGGGPGGRTTTGTAAWTATSGSTCTCATSWFTYWNEHDHRRHLYATGAYGDQSDAVRGDANAKPGRGGRRPGGGGGGGPNPNGGGGPNGDPPFGGDLFRRVPPPATPPTCAASSPRRTATTRRRAGSGPGR